MKRLLTRGVPQGGILSPLLWNLIFDELLELVNKNPRLASMQGYADDGQITQTGQNLTLMAKKVQRTLGVVNEWLADNGLELSPTKTTATVLTRKKQYDTPPLYINGQQIKYVKEFRYLGILIDDQLNFRSHVKNKITACKKALMHYQSLIGSTFGPKPKLSLWIWTAVIRPAFTYLAYIWGQVTDSFFQKDLIRLKSLALRLTGNFRRGTPNAALDAITNTPPLQQFIRGEVVRGYVRLYKRVVSIWDGKPSSKKAKVKGHILYAETLYESWHLPDLTKTDNIKPVIHCMEHFTTSYEPEVGRSRNAVHVYTDGSKQESGKTGCGYAIYVGDGPCFAQAFFNLSDENTVFQAEIVAIAMAMHDILDFSIDFTDMELHVHTDSQAAIGAINNPMINNHTVLACRNNLCLVGQEINLKIFYVPAHIGIEGNEAADQLAKRGANGSFNKLEVGTPPINYKSAIKHATFVEWTEKYYTYKMEQTKMWFPNLDPKLSREILAFPRGLFSRTVRFITGHCFLRRQNFQIDPTKYPHTDMCRLCKKEKERACHILMDCECLCSTRMKHFHLPFLSYYPYPFPHWTPSQLRGFLTEPSIVQLEESEEV